MIEVARIVEDGGSGQDRAGVFLQDELTVIVVADGAGGTAGGDLAADRVVAEVERTLRSALSLQNPLVWSACLAHVDRELGGAGETTAVIVVVTRDAILGASVGDSEARIFTAQGTIDLTHGQLRKPLIGSGRATPVAFREPVSHGLLIAATDGLWKYAKPGVFEAAAGAMDADRFAFDAMESVRLQSGHLQDDVALVTCRIFDGA